MSVKNSKATSSMQRAPRAFISYSWDSTEHRAWVLDFATRLRNDGIDITLDQWHLTPGDQLAEFMERAVRENDFVLIICTPKYKKRSNSRKGGVGYEGDIMTSEVLNTRNNRKFIPILRKGKWNSSAPSWLIGKYYVDLSGEEFSEIQYAELLKALRRQHPQSPPIKHDARVDSSDQPSRPATMLRGEFEIPHADLSKARLGHGHPVDLFCINLSNVIICSSIGAKLLDFTTNRVQWQIKCPTLKSALNRASTVLGLATSDQIHLWDLVDGKLLHSIPDTRNQIAQIEFHPDGNVLAVLGEFDYIRLVDTLNGQQSGELEVEGHRILHFNFSPVGDSIAVVCDDGSVRVFSLADLREFQRFEGFQGFITDVYYISNTQLLLATRDQWTESGTENGVWYLKDIATGREVRIFAQRENEHFGVVSPKKDLLAIAIGRTISILSLPSCQETQILKGHLEEVSTISISDDSRYLASGSALDQSVRLWDISTGRELQRIESFSPNFESLAVSKNGLILASGSLDGVIRLWEFPKGQETYRFELANTRIKSVAFSPEGRLLAAGGSDNTVRCFDISTGRQVRQFSGHIDEITSVSFDGSGRLLASADGKKTVRLWDLSSNQQIFGKSTVCMYKGGCTVALSSDGKLLAMGSDDKTTRLWEIPSGHEITSFPSEGYLHVAFSSDSRLLATSGGYITELWDVVSRKLVWRLQGNYELNEGLVWAMAFSPNNRWIALGNSYHYVQIVNAVTGQEVQRFRHLSSVISLAFFPDSQLLSSGSEDGTVTIWSVND